MDRNTLLAMGLSLLVITGWMMIEAEQQAARQQELEGAGQLIEESNRDSTPPTLAAPERPRTAPSQTPSGEVAEGRDPAASDREPATAPQTREEPARQFAVETPLYRATLSSQGVRIIDWVLKDYDARQDEGGGPLRLVEERGPLFSTPLEELGIGNLDRRVFTRVATEGAPDTARRFEFVLEEDGVRVVKRLDFDPENYAVQVEVEITNTGRRSLRPRFDVGLGVRNRAGADFKDAQLSILQRESLEREYLAGFGLPGFLGFGTPEKLLRVEDDVSWAGLDSRYFAVAIAPDVTRTASAELRATYPGEQSEVWVGYPADSDIPEGISLVRAFGLYAGPKDEERLRQFGSGLEESIDLGWSWVEPITKGFVLLLRRCYEIIPNYGIAIILLTIALRLVMAPLTHKQMKVMRKNSTQMAALQPQIKSVQERYADDAQKKNEEMMKIYREAGVNPLTMMGGGCLPMLLQLPIFIALYYALQSAIELRGAPFGLWIHDLSIPETLVMIPGLELPVRVLPLAMGASMVIQQKMTPTPSLDPAQARMMMTVMPIMFTVLFYGFPSGLVLYWFVSNLGMAQQWVINRQVS